MVRLVGLALLAISLPAAAWSKPPAGPPSEPDELRSTATRNFGLSGSNIRSDWDSAWLDTHTRVGPNARFGIGMFGLKSDRMHQSPATMREIGTARTRRAGVGFSLRF